MIKKNSNVKRARPSRLSLPSMIVFGSGILVLILILASFFSMSRPGKEDPYISELEQRIVILERALSTRNDQYQAARQDEDLQGRVDRMDTSWQRLDASLTLKTNLLAQRLDSMETRFEEINQKLDRPAPVPETIKKNDTEKIISPAPKVKKKVARKIKSKPSPRVHIVKKGETAYSISKAYGLTLKELKDLNRFSAATTIYPGQKIRIDP